jgi:hypothetical protein
MNTDPGKLSPNGIISKVPGGLHRDDADWESMRWNGKDSHGLQYSRFFSSPPMFFTAEGATLPLCDTYRGATLFLVSSGPSLKGVDLSPLKQPGIVTMGLNNSPKLLRPNLWTCVDKPDSFMRSIWLDPTIQKFAPLCHTDKEIFDNDSHVERDPNSGAIITHMKDGKVVPLINDAKGKFLFREPGLPMRVRDCPNMAFYRRNEHFHADQFLWEDTICWGNHGDLGGARSVNLVALRLAYLLGFRKVYLLGVDFNMTMESRYAFDQDRSASSVRGNNSSYATNMKRLAELKPYMDKEGFEVFNCNPNSALKVFPTAPLGDAIEGALRRFWCGGHPIDIAKENTYGLYDRDDRLKKVGQVAVETMKAAPKPTKNGVGLRSPREYSPEEKLEVKHRFDASKELLQKRKDAVKGIKTAEPKGALDEAATAAWVQALKDAKAAEEEMRVIMRTLEDEKRYKYGEDIKWGLWYPEDEAEIAAAEAVEREALQEGAPV